MLAEMFASVAAKLVCAVPGRVAAARIQTNTTMHQHAELMCFLSARYYGSTSRRILDATRQNYLSGFWAGRAGVAFHNAWIGSDSGIASPTGWVLSVDQLCLYRAQKVSLGSNDAGRLDMSLNSTWTINAGAFSDREASDWACAAVLHYDRELSLAEIDQVDPAG